MREFDPDALHAQVGAMFQHYVSNQATAKENIGLGSLPELEDERRWRWRRSAAAPRS